MTGRGGGGRHGAAGPTTGQVEENLRQLGRDHLDLVNLRTLPVGKPAGELDQVEAVARAHEVTAPQVRLA
jgi:hypothetical protein